MVLKAGIWGGGFAASLHAEALRALGVEIAAVCDSDEARARELARRFGAMRFGTDANLLLAEGGPEVVHIATPPALHTDMAVRALRAGKHVLCEKPLCLSNADALAIQAAANKSGKKLAVNYNVRSHAAVQKLGAAIRAGELGALRLVHGAYSQEFNALPAPYDWRYNPALAGGMRAITELGSHVVDLVRFLSGDEVAAVSATTLCARPDRVCRDGMMYPDGEGQPVRVESEDAAVLALKMKGGALCSFVLSEISPGRGNRLCIELVGDEAGAWWNSERYNEYHIGRKGQGVQSRIDGFAGGFAATFAEHFKAAYAWFAGGDGSGAAKLDSGLRNVFVLNAAHESAQSGGGFVEVTVGEDAHV